MVGGDGTVVTERTSQRTFVGIGWCELHQRASRPHAAVAKLTQMDGEPR